MDRVHAFGAFGQPHRLIEKRASVPVSIGSAHPAGSSQQDTRLELEPSMNPLTFLAAAVLSLTVSLPAMAACSDPAGPGVDWQGCDKSGVDLSPFVDLSGANLVRANLSGANLTGANLSSANLYAANLSRANLWGANLSHAGMVDANLTGANLLGATLTSSLATMDLRGATWIDGRICSRLHLGGCH
jgi:uncharacterized protein YjbI with pentapeptide repeats